MLMMLSKADIKLKSATRDDEDDTGDERAGSGERRSSSGGAGAGRLRRRSRMLSSTPFADWKVRGPRTTGWLLQKMHAAGYTWHDAFW